MCVCVRACPAWFCFNPPRCVLHPWNPLCSWWKQNDNQSDGTSLGRQYLLNAAAAHPPSIHHKTPLSVSTQHLYTTACRVICCSKREIFHWNVAAAASRLISLAAAIVYKWHRSSSVVLRSSLELRLLPAQDGFQGWTWSDWTDVLMFCVAVLWAEWDPGVSAGLQHGQLQGL